MIQKYLVTIIKKSCITGKPVWLYRGFSRGAARKAYHCACQRELKRIREWKKKAAQRTAGVRGLLNRCTGAFSALSELSDEQKNAAKELLTAEHQVADCHRDFYDHIIEERRRRKENKKWQRRKKKNIKN